MLEAAEPTRWQWDTAGSRCPSIEGSQSPSAKSPFLSHSPHTPTPKSSQEITSM